MARLNSASAGPQPKCASFRKTPGVYLMKDAAGRVIYIGKAKNLRARASSYFLKAAAEDRRTAELVREICDIDFVAAESEVDALLAEARLIKDVQPKYNQDLKDDKTFPYLEIITREDFPRVEFTREPSERGTKLYGPFASAGSLRGAIQVLQRIFKFRTCTLDIDEGDEKWRWFRPCLLASIDQCTAPCNLRISKEDYRRDIQRLKMFLEGNKHALLEEMQAEMREAAAGLKFEKAARLRDEIRMLETLDDRGELETHVQPEVFFVDPKKGLAGLQKVLKLADPPRTIEGVDIAHLGGEDTVASLVQFIDGLPFKPHYRRFKIRGVPGIDDFASIHEVIARRFQRQTRRRRNLSRHPADRRRQGTAFGRNGGFRAIGHRAADGHFAGQAGRRDLPARRERAAAIGSALYACDYCNTCATKPTGLPSTIITCCGANRCWGISGRR